MNIDLIAMITMLIIMIMFAIGILLALIIIGADQCTTPKEEFYENDAQMEYLKEYQDKKDKRFKKIRRLFLWMKNKLQ